MVMSKKQRDAERKTSAKKWNWRDEQDGGGFEPTCIKLPEGVEWYKLEKDSKPIVDFIPFICGSKHPKADEGMECSNCPYAVHWIPSPNGRNKPYLCPSGTYNKPCPICKWVNTHGGAADKELVQAIKARYRYLWNINDKPGKENNPIKVLDTNSMNRGTGFAELLKDLAREADNDIFDLRDGSRIKMKVVSQTIGNGKPFPAVVRFDALPREKQYSLDMLNKAVVLDECLMETDEDELEKIFLSGIGGGSDDGDEDRPKRPKSSSNGKSRPKDDEDENEEDDETPEDEDEDEDEVSEDEDEEEEEAPKKPGPKAKTSGIKKGDFVLYTNEDGDEVECEVKKASPDGKKLILEDQDGVQIKATPGDVSKVATQDDAEDEDEDEEEEEEAPKKRGPKKPQPKGKDKKKPTPKKGSRKDDDEDEEEDEDPYTDDDDDDEPLEDEDDDDDDD